MLLMVWPHLLRERVWFRQTDRGGLRLQGAGGYSVRVIEELLSKL